MLVIYKKVTRELSGYAKKLSVSCFFRINLSNLFTKIIEDSCHLKPLEGQNLGGQTSSNLYIVLSKYSAELFLGIHDEWGVGVIGLCMQNMVQLLLALSHQ